MDDITKKLVSLLPSSNNSKSSYWKFHTENISDFQLDKVLKDYWSVKKRSFKNIFMYGVFNFIVFIFHLKIYFSKSYTIVSESCSRLNCVIDFDAFRHAISINKIFNYIKDSYSLKKICVIGDGKANIVGPLLCRKISDLKIISVNLPEALIHDHLLLINSDLIDMAEISIANDEREMKKLLKDDNIKLILVSAQNASILKKKEIDLFVNIHSFQEMTKEIIKKYFDIISSNNAYFYCENRELKKLYGGELIEFDKYPWMKGRKFIFDYVNWGNLYYTRKFPFIRKKKSKMKYAIVKY